VSRESVTTALWGLFLLALALLLLAWEASALQLGLLGGAAAVVLVLAAALRWLPGQGRSPEAPETSYATLVLAAGLALALAGAVFGLWLLLPGLALAVLGGSAAVREARR
jgi:hypothetical protein